MNSSPQTAATTFTFLATTFTFSSVFILLLSSGVSGSQNKLAPPPTPPSTFLIAQPKENAVASAANEHIRVGVLGHGKTWSFHKSIGVIKKTLLDRNVSLGS